MTDNDATDELLNKINLAIMERDSWQERWRIAVDQVGELTRKLEEAILKITELEMQLSWKGSE